MRTKERQESMIVLIPSLIIQIVSLLIDLIFQLRIYHISEITQSEIAGILHIFQHSPSSWRVDISNSQLAANRVNGMFSEEICKLLAWGHERTITFESYLGAQIKWQINFNMLCPVMKYRITSYVNSCLIVTVERSRILYLNAKFFQKRSQPSKLTSSLWHNSIFSFSARTSHNRLFFYFSKLLNCLLWKYNSQWLVFYLKNLPSPIPCWK